MDKSNVKPKIHYLKGNVTNPIHSETVICHICNDVNKMGSGVAKALADKWPLVKMEYHDWAARKDDPTPFELGNTIFVVVETGIDEKKYIKSGIKKKRYIIVANMIAQHRIKSMGEEKPIRYDALDKCLKEVYEFCRDNNMILSMPRIGTERAGGDWVEIEKIIQKNILVNTYVYDWDGK